jgi:DUF971 family protein
MTRVRAPVLIDGERHRDLTLTWADGTTCRFDLQELRQHCRCAECRMRRERSLPVWPRSSSPDYSWELLRPDDPRHDS